MDAELVVQLQAHLPLKFRRETFSVHSYTPSLVIITPLLSAEPPSFIQGPESVKKAAQKQEVSLKCRTFGAPKPVITWTKDGKPIDDVHRIHVKKNGDLKIKVRNKNCSLLWLLPMGDNDV